MPRDAFDALAALPVDTSPEPWPMPDLDLASADPTPPPALAVRNLFPAPWAEWIEAAAECKGAPVDYVATALLSVAGGLIGNARWAQPWNGWQEPPALNAALIGDPSSGKSPGLDALTIPLTAIEADDNADLAERKRQHATDKQAAGDRRTTWQAEVKTATSHGAPPPLMPADAEDPPPPQRRRVYSVDPTVEKAARMSAANPRGLLLHRDELAGWVAGMDRYSNGAGSDRAFWLQAYGGRAWAPDRVKDGDSEVFAPHLTWAIVGTIQPDRLRSLLMSGDNDGLAARFLYAWPAPQRPPRPRDGLRTEQAQPWLTRLRALPWTPPEPVMVPFSSGAAEALQCWREEAAEMEQGTHGLFLSWLGKLPGFAVRLSLIFAYLEWCSEGTGDPPAVISERDVGRALDFLADYAVPMARRCFGEAAIPEAERDSRTLLRWILGQKPIPELRIPMISAVDSD